MEAIGEMPVPAYIWRNAIAAGGLYTGGERPLDKLPVPTVKVHLESAVGVEWSGGEMREVEDILELLKGKPYSAGELKAYSKLSEEKVQDIVSFMQKQDLIEVHSNEITITESGLELLNLSPDSEVTKSASLYSEETKKRHR